MQCTVAHPNQRSTQEPASLYCVHAPCNCEHAPGRHDASSQHVSPGQPGITLGFSLHRCRKVVFFFSFLFSMFLHAFRAGEAASEGLTEALLAHGFETDRLKTGTPARVDSRSVDFTHLEAQPGDEQVKWFSFDEEVYHEDVPCLLIFMTWTFVGATPALGTVRHIRLCLDHGFHALLCSVSLCRLRIQLHALCGISLINQYLH